MIQLIYSILFNRVLSEARVRDRLLHREPGVLAVVAHETDLLAVDELARVEVGHAANLGLHALLLELRDELDARLALMQRLRHVVERVAETRSDAWALNSNLELCLFPFPFSRHFPFSPFRPFSGHFPFSPGKTVFAKRFSSNFRKMMKHGA